MECRADVAGSELGDDEECGVRPILQCGHRLPFLTLGSCGHSILGTGDRRINVLLALRAIAANHAVNQRR
jgi:hypothetical protein